MTNYTPIADTNLKLDIIDHINQDHTEEVMIISKSYLPKEMANNNNLTATIVDIFEEGMSVSTGAENDHVFIPFEIEGDLEEKVLYLAYAAMVKQGKSLSGNRKQFFEVIGKEKITKNFVRLKIKSNQAFPQNKAGYSYALLLKIMKKKSKKPVNQSDKSSSVMNTVNRLFLWVMKKVSKEQRQKVLDSMNKNVRLYTLSKTLDDKTGFVDIYIHGNSPGSVWVDALKKGDVIISRAEAEDKHEHLDTGKALLIADETGYPALAGILSLWKNPTAPEVIVISAKKEEQAYFSNHNLPKNTKVHQVVCDVDKQADRVIDILKSLPQFDVAWGALENASAKKVRHYLRNECHILGKNNRLKGYWRLNQNSH